MTVEDPIAVLCEVAKEAMRRLGADFEVTVKGDYRKFPLVLTVTVEEYGEETGEGGSPAQP